MEEQYVKDNEDEEDAKDDDVKDKKEDADTKEENNYNEMYAATDDSDDIWEWTWWKYGIEWWRHEEWRGWWRMK